MVGVEVPPPGREPLFEGKDGRIEAETERLPDGHPPLRLLPVEKPNIEKLLSLVGDARECINKPPLEAPEAASVRSLLQPLRLRCEEVVHLQEQKIRGTP